MRDIYHRRAISSGHLPPPPSSSGPGLFSRLLKRGREATKINRLSRWSIGGAELYIAIPPEPSADDGGRDEPAGSGDTTVDGVITRAPNRPTTAPGFRTGSDTPPPNANTGASSGNNGRASSSDPPMLSRRPSLRARLRFRAPSNPQAEVQATPRTIYVPTHAAADFSRMAVSPRYVNGLDGNETLPGRRLEPIKSTEDLVEDVIKGARPLPPLDDREELLKGSPAAAFEAKTPLEAHQAENTRPSRRSLDGPHETAAAQGAEHQDGGQSPSDFQLFLAQAEAEDRAQRIQIWRSLSSASRGPPLNQYQPPPLDGIPEAEPRIGNGAAAVSRPKRDNSYAARYGKRATWDSAYSGNYMFNGAAPKPSGLGSRTRASSDMPGSGPPAAANARTPGFVGASSGINYDSRQPRDLTRQSSLVKKVADYIRPPRDDSRTGSRVSTKSD